MGAWPFRSPVLGVLLYLCLPRTAKFGMVPDMREERVLGCQPRYCILHVYMRRAVCQRQLSLL